MRTVTENVIAELDLTMGLAGVASLEEIGPDALASSPLRPAGGS